MWPTYFWPTYFWPGYFWPGYTIEDGESVPGGSTSITAGMSSSTYTNAYNQVYEVVQRGVDVTLTKSATTDEFGSNLTDSNVTFKAFPVRFNPYDRDVYQKISWAGETDIICYISKKEVDLAGYTLLQLKKSYKYIRHASKTYDIKYVEYYMAFFDDHLYLVVGGVK